jgi:hypothetical protein
MLSASEMRTVMSGDDHRTADELAADLMEGNPGGDPIPRGRLLNRNN